MSPNNRFKETKEYYLLMPLPITANKGIKRTSFNGPLRYCENFHHCWVHYCGVLLYYIFHFIIFSPFCMFFVCNSPHQIYNYRYESGHQIHEHTSKNLLCMSLNSPLSLTFAGSFFDDCQFLIILFGLALCDFKKASIAISLSI